MEEVKEVTIYTDGACKSNPGPGGWAFVVIGDAGEEHFSGGERGTTNNRMELLAVINALTYIMEGNAKNDSVKLFTDSQYVKNGITTWIKTWKTNAWRTSARKPVKNQDLWEKLDALNSALTVHWSWVKGHALDKYNELCDKLASAAAESFK